jgi:hypothetical protein
MQTRRPGVVRGSSAEPSDVAADALYSETVALAAHLWTASHPIPATHSTAADAGAAVSVSAVGGGARPGTAPVHGLPAPRAAGQMLAPAPQTVLTWSRRSAEPASHQRAAEQRARLRPEPRALAPPPT